MQSALHFYTPVLPLTPTLGIPAFDDRMTYATAINGNLTGAPSTYTPPGALPLQWVGQPQGSSYGSRQPIMLEAEPMPGRRFLISSLLIPLSVFVYTTANGAIAGSKLSALPQGEVGVRFRLFKNQELLTQQAEQYSLTQVSQGQAQSSPSLIYYQMNYAADVLSYDGVVTMDSGDKLGMEIDFDPQSTTQMYGAGGATSGYLPGVVLGSMTPQVAIAQSSFINYTVTPGSCIYNIQKG